MKNKYILPGLVIMAITIAAISGCKKDSSDLTADVVGRYKSGTGSDAVEIVVTKIDEETISVSVEPACCSSSTHANTMMKTATSFTLNTVSEQDGFTKSELSGFGSYSANNIVVVRHEKITVNSALLSEEDITFTGVKQ